MGGPIVKNRTFFHAAFEQEHNRGQNGSDIDPSVASAIDSFMATGAFPRLKIRHIPTGFFPIARAETEASGKLNHQLSSQNALMVRYAFTNQRDSAIERFLGRSKTADQLLPSLAMAAWTA